MDPQDPHNAYYDPDANLHLHPQLQPLPQQQYYAPPQTQSPYIPIYTSHHAPQSYPTTNTYGSSSSSPTIPQYTQYATSDASDADPEADLKRLRNTAASARFRAKKKMREQTLESQAREKRERLERLENRIAELERENSFLKGLIMGPKDEELKSLKKQRDDVIEADRKGFEHKDGVGTDE